MGSTYLDRSVWRRRLGIAETRETKLVGPTVLDPLVVSQVTSGVAGSLGYLVIHNTEYSSPRIPIRGSTTGDSLASDREETVGRI